MRFFEPGLCSVTFRSLSPQAVIDLAAANGIRSIEWGGDIHVPPGDLGNARDVGERTAKAGLTVSSYGSYIFAPDFAPDDVTAVLETARALGAGHIRIWPGSRKRPSADYSPGERRAATEALATIARLAHDYGITIGLEYHPNSLTDTLPSALQLMQDLPVPNLFFYWQPAPGLPLNDALAEISALGSRICHLHVFAWLADASRLPLHERADYWRACVGALPEGDWTKTAYAMLEFVKGDDVGQFAEDAAVLSNILYRT
ncbi:MULTISPECIES: TIM barrel protein [unclassified Agrobacterium]|uniref:sugar phosphate isomerase/epimerase family protein n=1 Tax=unclassified Agrobacterium TaxID=2632611 RepID=UPI00244CC480|nr:MULTISPECIES: TIM barrel protein [unclassified Agrobacterium]MDH0616018.1 sugar phosphate isomerase/epimerase [Agrobacterium sp. GD03872]MDH0697691.1 sugar phosphate isomerase/epimerase [Agrobacterium sp. GD03871]MDH1061218.1 sugar phosphate isomerase/epimerase [Agrobacterium sp. GD03992]MDH2212734.1 sugar phosphate isomerase/epimerase [Agrobacterium sp. GD03643]MDH2221387.1 sugar phosphate isomerase/epimerase [Agrobacterium sp. GD03638]